MRPWRSAARSCYVPFVETGKKAHSPGCVVMVHRTYQGLGSGEAAIREFDGLAPFASQLFALQQECVPMSADEMALRVATESLETAAYHFTRRRHYYDALRPAADAHRKGNERLGDLAEALAAFEALSPYANRLTALKARCRPFHYDWCALEVAHKGLETAAYHFTRLAAFYGAKGDSAGTAIR